jgi:hypothetical protein
MFDKPISELDLLNIKVRLKQLNSVIIFITMTLLNLVTLGTDIKLERFFYKLRCFLTLKSDISSATKCDQNPCSSICKFGHAYSSS